MPRDVVASVHIPVPWWLDKTRRNPALDMTILHVVNWPRAMATADTHRALVALRSLGIAPVDGRMSKPDKLIVYTSIANAWNDTVVALRMTGTALGRAVSYARTDLHRYTPVGTYSPVARAQYWLEQYEHASKMQLIEPDMLRILHEQLDN